MHAPASSLFDQTALTDRAERLVKAALARGADAADAVALRGMSLAIEVRDGAVEESERAERARRPRISSPGWPMQRCWRTIFPISI